MNHYLGSQKQAPAHYYSTIIVLHDIARPHAAWPVKIYLETLHWKILIHPLYSPDIVPSDDPLVRKMAAGHEVTKHWIDS